MLASRLCSAAATEMLGLNSGGYNDETLRCFKSKTGDIQENTTVFNDLSSGSIKMYLLLIKSQMFLMQKIEQEQLFPSLM